MDEKKIQTLAHMAVIFNKFLKSEEVMDKILKLDLKNCEDNYLKKYAKILYKALVGIIDLLYQKEENKFKASLKKDFKEILDNKKTFLEFIQILKTKKPFNK